MATFSAFLLAVAYVAWPGAVLVFGLGGITLVGLQYIVRGIRLLIVTTGKLIDIISGFIRTAYLYLRSKLTPLPSPAVLTPS